MMNKTHIQSLIILIILALGLGLFPISFTQSAANLPVFPGCQGFGCETVGGRGGRIIKVTNLNDSGPGSLRVAVEASGPRIVVFETSGTIALSSEIRITNPYLTIAGQTAPSPGITIKNYGLEIYTHDILIQHVRIRIGDQTPPADRLENLDAINTAYSAEAYNIVVDHVSLSWSIDGTFDIGGSTARERNITLSRSILSEHLRNAGHEKTGHSRALLVAEHTHKVSIIGNLLAHNVERNPLIGGNSKVVVANNLVYNWVGGKFNALLLADRYGNVPKLGNFWISILKNAYLKGPNTAEPAVAITVRGPNEEVGPGTKVYLDDNVADVKVYQNDASFEVQVSTPPISISGFTPLPSSQVYDHVLANAGARPADRDVVDKRVVQEVKDRKGKIIDSQSEVGGWPTLAVNQRTFTIPANPNGDSDNDGYTNIEEVLHQMAAEVEGKATPVPSVNSFYVSTTGSDSNSCAAAQNINTPKRTLNNAVSCLSAGKTLYIRGGTYKESLVNGVIPPGDSWNNPVTIAAYPGETVIMRPDPGATFIFQFIGPQKYIIIDGLVLDGANISHDVIKITWATATGYSHHIRIANSEVMNSQKNSGCTKKIGNKGNFGPCGMGMLITAGSDYNEFINLKVHDNGKTDFDHGIYLGSHNNLIENSSFYNNAGWGIQKYPAGDNNIIRNNKIYNNARDGFRGVGIGMYGGTDNLVEGNTVYGNKDGIGAQYGERNLTISNKTIYNNSNYGIYSEAPNTTLRGNKVSQNGKDFGGTTITAPVESPPVPAPTPTPIPTTIQTPSYTSLYSSTSPVVDGNLIEYASAPRLTVNSPIGGVGTYRLLWDNSNLYVAAEVTDIQLNANVLTRDGSLWNDDSIELLFDTLSNKGASLQADDYKFFANLRNIQHDSRGGSASYNTNFTSAVRLQGTLNQSNDLDTGYTMEIKIPWSAMDLTGPPVAGSSMG